MKQAHLGAKDNFRIERGQKNIPQEFIGQWRTKQIQITVRTEPEKGKFEFTSDSADIVLIIKSDNTAAGYIGSARFENARIKKKFGNPEKKGIDFKIECGRILTREDQ